MDVLILVAARCSEGTPTALLQVDGETLVGRLQRQCEAFAPRRTVVLAAPGTGQRLREEAPGAEVLEVVTLVEALTQVRRVLDAADSVGMVLADVVLHASALAAVLERSSADAVLTGPTPATSGTPLRSVRGRVVAAGSPLHVVEAPNRVGLGVVHVGPGGCASLRTGLDELVTALRNGSDAGEAAGRLLDDGLEALLPLVQVVVVRRAEATLIDVPVRDFHRSRPDDPAQARTTEEALAASDEDDLRLAAAVKSRDGFFTTFLVSPYSRHIARWSARRGFTPNQVTAASFAVGVASAASFALGGRAAAVVGAVLLQAAFTLDCVDGQLARYTRRFSSFGAWLDSVFDRGKEYLVYAGLAVGATRSGDTVWLLAACAITLQTLRHHVDFAYAAQQGSDAVALARVPLLQPHEPGRSHWEAEPAANARPGGAGGLVAEVLRSARRMEGGGLRWLKRIVVLPIGERFALISLTAALFTPRVTFLALLLWGGGALAYTATGRMLRSHL